MMIFDALFRRGTGINLLNSDETGVGNAASSLHHFRLKSLLAPLTPYTRWWLAEMKAMLPQRIGRMFSERRLLVRASQGEVCIAEPNSAPGQEICHVLPPLYDSGEITPVLEKRRCDLLLDSSHVLERELELPLEAEASLRRVLAFSMDRYTPFNENDVLFDYKVIRRDGVSRKITLKLYVAPRDAVESMIQHLGAMGIEPAALDVACDASSRVGVNLLAPEKRPGNPGMRRGDRALSVLALTLLLVVVASPFVLRQQAASALESELAQLRGQLRQAEADRMEVNKRIERMRQIEARNTAKPALLDVLLELTRLMPDDAWAGQVAIKSGRVRLTGESGAASELLAKLSSSSIFFDPKFEAPLTQNPKTGRERFVISLAIKGHSDGA